MYIHIYMILHVLQKPTWCLSDLPMLKAALPAKPERCWDLIHTVCANWNLIFSLQTWGKAQFCKAVLLSIAPCWVEVAEQRHEETARVAVGLKHFRQGLPPLTNGHKLDRSTAPFRLWEEGGKVEWLLAYHIHIHAPSSTSMAPMKKPEWPVSWGWSHHIPRSKFERSSRNSLRPGSQCLLCTVELRRRTRNGPMNGRFAGVSTEEYLFVVFVCVFCFQVWLLGSCGFSVLSFLSFLASCCSWLSCRFFGFGFVWLLLVSAFMVSSQIMQTIENTINYQNK